MNSTHTLVPPRPAPSTIGVLGGMGPLATVDFLRKLVAATPAGTDQQHIPLIVRFCPEVPDRVDALFGRGPSPEAALVRAARLLDEAGAQALAMPCNTAHAWHEAIAAAIGIPILHIVDTTLAAIGPWRSGRIGLLATTGTLNARVYRQRGGGDVDWLEPSASDLETLVMPGIRAVKAHRIDEGRALLGAAAQALCRQGAELIVLACTEIPIALADFALPVPAVDPTDGLARACVAWATAGR